MDSPLQVQLQMTFNMMQKYPKACKCLHNYEHDAKGCKSCIKTNTYKVNMKFMQCPKNMHKKAQKGPKKRTKK